MDFKFNYFPIQIYFNESVPQMVITYDLSGNSLPFIKGLMSFSANPTPRLLIGLVFKSMTVLQDTIFLGLKIYILSKRTIS